MQRGSLAVSQTVSLTIPSGRSIQKLRLRESRQKTSQVIRVPIVIQARANQTIVKRVD